MMTDYDYMGSTNLQILKAEMKANGESVVEIDQQLDRMKSTPLIKVLPVVKNWESLPTSSRKSLEDKEVLPRKHSLPEAQVSLE